MKSTFVSKLYHSLLLPFIFLNLLACDKDTFPKYSSLGGLRILALTVNTPEVQNPAAGTVNISLDPYLSDLNGTGNITLEIQSCLDSGVNLGALPDCSNGLSASTLQTETITAPAGQAAGVFGDPERTGTPSTGAITVGLAVPAGLLASFSSVSQFNGVAYIITVKATRGSESVKSFRRILFSTKTPNANPSIADLFSEGATLTSLPTKAVPLSFTATGSAESFQRLLTDGSTVNETETFETTWFVSDGTIESARTLLGETSAWSPPSSAPVGRSTLVIGVLRDGRGGVNVMTKKF